MSASDATEVAGVARWLSIADVAARTGLSADTLRFYEREGLFAEHLGAGTAGTLWSPPPPTGE